MANPRLARAGGGLLAAAGLAAALGGCVSTQQKAAWLHVQDARLITAQSPTVVRTSNRAVRIQAVTLLRHGGRVAVAVRLRNLTDRTLSDLPISVGVRRVRSRPAYLNGSADLGYFQTHVAVLPARGALTWVLEVSARHLPAGRVFARVGPRAAPATSPGRVPPRIRTRLISDRGGVLRLQVTNHSPVPQPQLQLYAVTPGTGRVTAAGSTTVSQLGTDQTVTANLTLVGHPAGRPELEALPTLFLP